MAQDLSVEELLALDRSSATPPPQEGAAPAAPGGGQEVSVEELLGLAGQGTAPRPPPKPKPKGFLAQYPVGPESQPTMDAGWLGRTLEALDYAGNISRSGIAGAVKPKGNAFAYAAQAALRKRYTDPSTLKDLLTKRAGLGKVRWGKDDQEFQPGDIADFGTDFALDVVTDPLNLVSFGLSSLAKGGALAKALPGVAKAATAYKMGAALPEGSKFGKGMLLGKMGVGATLGAGTADENAPMRERVTRAGLGALGAYGLTKAGPSISAGIRGVTDRIMDEVALLSGKEFANFSAGERLARAGKDKAADVAEWIATGRKEALKGLTPVEEWTANVKMTEFKDHFVNFREDAKRAYAEVKESDIEKMAKRMDPDELERAMAEGDFAEKLGKAKEKTAHAVKQALESRKARMGDDNYNRWYNSMTEGVTRQVDEMVPDILKRENDNVRRAVKDWTGHNQRVVERLNKEGFGIKSGKWVNIEGKGTGKGVVGVKYHIPDVYEVKDMVAAEDLLRRTKKLPSVHEVTARQRAWFVSRSTMITPAQSARVRALA